MPLENKPRPNTNSASGASPKVATNAGRNNTGMPSQLKSGMEQLSGVDMSSVRVHYNTPKPATVQAHAYAQGNAIHLGPGQEKHLPHELGHVVQQMEGRVKPTTSVSGTAVNDNPGLEREADAMGQRAMTLSKASSGQASNTGRKAD